MKTNLFILTFICVLLIPAYAQERGKEEIPPGMELLEMGAARVVVPKDTKARKVGSLVILEERIAVIETKEAELQAKDAELKQEIEKLKQAIAEIKTLEPPAEERSF